MGFFSRRKRKRRYLDYYYGFDNELKPKNIKRKDWEKEEWEGYSYYKGSGLSYRYVDQMANALTGRHDIKVKSGNYWAVNVKDRYLIYDPDTLVTGTKGRLLACLLHEIGHIRYTVGERKLLKSPYLDKYGEQAFHVINLFEDIRIDNLMMDSYEGAKEVLKANQEIVKKIAERYKKTGEMLNHTLRINLKRIRNNKSDLGEDVKEKDMIRAIKELVKENGTLFDYCAVMLLVGYDVDINIPKELKEKVEKTKHALILAIQQSSTIDLVSMLNTEVFPVIEDLFQQMSNEGSVNKKNSKKTNPSSSEQGEGGNSSDTTDSKGQKPKQGEDQKEKDKEDTEGNDKKEKDKEEKKKGSGDKENKEKNKESDELIKNTKDSIKYSDNFFSSPDRSTGDVSEKKTREEEMINGSSQSKGNDLIRWASGDYNKLKKSIDSVIQKLANKLIRLKREEMARKWITNQKRGKLDVRKIYKHRSGGTRLFKKEREREKEISSYAFSLLLDISGSMWPMRIFHSLRGAIAISEALNKAKIPFEFIVFGTGADTLKEFDKPLTKNIKSRMAGLLSDAQGDTNLYRALDRTKIQERTEKNKVMLIISDGGVGSMHFSEYQERFRDMKKKHKVQTIGVGIGCGDSVKELCLGNGFAIDMPRELPDIFIKVLKDTLKMKR